MENNKKTLIPPNDFSDDELEVWCRILDSLEDGWITDLQRDSLVAFCRHVVQADYVAGLIREAKANRKIGDIIEFSKLLNKLTAMLDRENRAVSSLATKLRISNQSLRSSKESPEARASSFKPWEDDDE